MKSWAIHYKNKYPGSRVSFDENGLDVYSEEGHHLIAIRKSGAGQFMDCSEEFGCFERHDLAPIPKDSRVHKLHKDGKMGFDEKAEERIKKSERFDSDFSYKKIKSCEELENEGYKFHADGSIKEEPAKA